jgi:hypothetical protein
VRIIPEIAGADLAVEREVFTGRIFFIDTRVDPLSQTCKVLVKCANRDRLLRAGLEARMEIQTDRPAADAAADAAGGQVRNPDDASPTAAPESSASASQSKERTG